MGGGDDVGSELVRPVGSFGGDIEHYVRVVVFGGVLRVDGLPVLVFWATVDVVDGVPLGHLRIGPNSTEVWLLNKNKINRRVHGRSDLKNGMGRDVVLVYILGKDNKIRRKGNGG